MLQVFGGIGLLVIILACLYAYAMEYKRRIEVEESRELLGELYVGLCTENTELVKRLAHADAEVAQARRYYAELELEIGSLNAYIKWLERKYDEVISGVEERVIKVLEETPHLDIELVGMSEEHKAALAIAIAMAVNPQD